MYINDINDIRFRKSVLDECLKGLLKKIKDFKISIDVCRGECLDDCVKILESKLKGLKKEYDDKFDERKELMVMESSFIEGCEHVWERCDKDCERYWDEKDKLVICETYVCTKCGKTMIVEDYE